MPCYRFCRVDSKSIEYELLHLLKWKKNKGQKRIFHLPPSSNVLFFILFLTSHHALNFIEKPWCIKVLKNSESTNTFFAILQDGAKHHERYLGLVPSFDLKFC